MKYFKVLWVVAQAAALLMGLGAAPAAFLPVTGEASAVVTAGTQPVPLVTQVSAGQVFSYKTVQQPANNPAYVSSKKDVLTQFNLAGQYGTLGFLAHNYLAGATFSKLKVGDLVTVTLQDGSTVTYQVAEILSYQALSSKDPYTDLVNLSTKTRQTVTDVFMYVYGKGGRLVLQTCISANGDDSWGRLFVVALPYQPDNKTPSH